MCNITHLDGQKEQLSLAVSEVVTINNISQAIDLSDQTVNSVIAALY